MECLVRGCVNKDHEGDGFFLDVAEPSYGWVGHEWICAPCWLAMRGNQGAQYSQVFRNMKKQFFQNSEHDVEKYYKDDYEGD